MEVDGTISMKISREAARLFVRQGVSGTSGDAIAAAAGISTRTVWRHFRNKEACLGPILAVSIRRLARILEEWPMDRPLEAHLQIALPLEGEDPQLIADGRLSVQLVALAATEPDIRTGWLEAYHELERQLHDVVARRANRSTLDLDVQLCAGTIAAAIRILDQAISVAAIGSKQTFTPEELVSLLSDTIRTAATLPICDPVTAGIHDLSARRRRAATPD